MVQESRAETQLFCQASKNLIFLKIKCYPNLTFHFFTVFKSKIQEFETFPM